jgi:hypothetical protein
MIMDLIKALQAGKELSDPAKWKNRQNLTNTVGVMVVAIAGLIKWKFPDFTLPAGLEDYIIEVTVGVLGAVNLYLTTATSKKVGVK